jgi:hypothetical protein
MWDTATWKSDFVEPSSTLQLQPHHYTYVIDAHALLSDFHVRT